MWLYVLCKDVCTMLDIAIILHTGIGPKPKRNDFSDLLGGNFSSSANSGPRTLKAMRAESDINNALDPDKAKVHVYPCQEAFLSIQLE